MATKYSMKVQDTDTRNWTPVALFSDLIPLDILADMGHIMWSEIDGVDDIAIVDMDTNEVVWCYSNDAQPDEPAWIDDDCGFDPYLGCYTDDV